MKDLGPTMVWAVHCDLEALIIIGSRDMTTTFNILEHCHAPILFIGAADLQLSNLSALLPHQHVGEACGTTMWT